MNANDSPLWVPSAERAASTAIARLCRTVDVDGYEALHRWSTADPDHFWAMMWQELGVIGDRGERIVVAGDDLASTRFYPDAVLSFAENMLAQRGAGADEVAAAAAALASLGVGEGDRVAALLPSSIEAVVTLLAASSLGAVFSSTSPDFGPRGVLDRFAQIEPTVLVAITGYRYGGKFFDRRDQLVEIRRGLPGLAATVVVGDIDGTEPDGAIGWDRFLADHRGADLVPRRLPFDHPLYVLYSSGTTGAPKCIVHSAGGVLVQHLKEQQLHCDIRAGDRVLYFTTTGWMMFNWLVSVLGSGATAVLYDGNPLHPGPGALFDIAEAEALSLLGVSAAYIDAVRRSGIEPARAHEMPALRTVCSTGSPLSPESFAFVYDSIASDVHLASISGGTDLCGCLVAGDPTSPVYAGEIQGPVLGMDIDVVDDASRSLRNRPGTPGELICRNPFPSMPLRFWGDDDGKRYHDAYFSKIPGVWAQGDFAAWTDHGGMVVLGRSDATLNPGGVRIGTAEIYNVVDAMPEVVESLAFGQRWEGDIRIVLLVHLAEGLDLDDELRSSIRSAIRAECSPRHVPAVVAQVPDLPRTRSNKLVEVAVADVVHGRPLRNTEALANPEAFGPIVALDELRR